MAATKQSANDGKSWSATAGTGDRHSFLGISGSLGKIIAIFGAIFLMTATPAFVMAITIVMQDYGSDVSKCFQDLSSKTIWEILSLYPAPTVQAVKYVAVFGVWQGLMQVLMPGYTVHGPLSPKGNIPVYKANGVQCLLFTWVTLLGAQWLGLFDLSLVYDEWPAMLAVTNILGLSLTAFLMVKGLTFPSSSDSGSTGYFVYDFFWGTELYPRIGKSFDFKVWTNCRMGMMGWSVLPLCYAAKQLAASGYIADSMIVAILIMEAYIFKFFLWESGYWRTMDIAHDRAGFYLVWGCLNWLVGIYTTPILHMVQHPIVLGHVKAACILGCGLVCVYINYDADRQRQKFRASGGRMNVWGSKPTVVNAKYDVGDGEQKSSLLLASGWWGISRHFHYVPEILASFFWTLPAGFTYIIPYFYVVYLTILLVDRLYRDDVRCASKYGQYWQQYCKLVPYKMIPGIF